ncbi:uncharacterized protein FOMMEDRAFT_30742 [Fomitiporia mediterranea MF3/22]|uniref:uncharacterized protein n=1 Tax=Fomitiporia mediterranea (strain MF3/22) TaxID=694068 RepID=UPI0004408EC7|nr:uncharacterized protein FOMMEDRAFT_30742 [Fomitiporia mediterranea MF3/22]EJD00058.1 hypothetical protein FOMMEDRAFT_30742 [Fomitiporia mediterranea MF3/22]
MYEQNVVANDLCIPNYLGNLEHVHVRDIQSWVKHAVLLDRNYRTPYKKLHAWRIANREKLGITWLRLVHGHWALVASADVHTCEFSVWEIPPEGEIRQVARVFLDAPVIDGMADESCQQVHCAITIGASAPYILIFNIIEHAEKVTLDELISISGASHVRFFRGSCLGFATWKNDDSYPHIIDWKNWNSYKLHIPSSALSQVPSLLPFCTLGMANFWMYPKTKLGKLDDQDKTSAFRQAVILRNRGMEQTRAFNLCETLSISPWTAFPESRPPVLTDYALGLSGRRLFCVTTLKSHCWLPPTLSTMPIELTVGSDEENQLFTSFGDYVPVSREALPLPHLITSLSFDDGNGYLLMGTRSGDVRLAAFMDKNIIRHECVHIESLGSLATEVVTPVSQKLSEPDDASRIKAAVPPDLPVFYTIRETYKFGDELPPSIREDVTSDWFDEQVGKQTFSNWSNDWSQFECLWDWVIPLSRWGPIDKDFFNTTPSIFARNRLQALGDLIPVLYDVTNHKRVVFRNGERMFFCRSERNPDHDDDSDEEETVAFEGEPDIFLCILPCTYSQYSGDPPSIIRHLPSRDIHAMDANLRDWRGSQTRQTRCSAANVVYQVREHHEMLCKQYPDDDTMAGWTGEEWDRLFYDLCGLSH